MRSDQQTTANRPENRRSRGPTTSAGKAKSRANALRHGLASTVLAPGHLRDDVETLAKAIAGHDAGDFQLALARQIAAAQVDLLRVQSAKVALLNAQVALTSPRNEQPAAKAIQAANPNTSAVELEETPMTEDIVLIPSTDILNQLARLDRYERRAIARYRRAARGFIIAQAHGGPKSR